VHIEAVEKIDESEAPPDDGSAEVTERRPDSFVATLPCKEQI
jgi:hypothetical protein